MSNIQKNPITLNLAKFGQQRAQDEIAKLGLGIPGKVVMVTGAMVSVALEVSGITNSPITMPIAESAYARLPIQPDDVGMAVPASFALGVVSGLGSNVSDTTQQGNLSNLVWMPISSTSFAGVNRNILMLSGPAGVYAQDIAGTAIISITTNQIQLTAAGNQVTINEAGVTINGVLFLAHTHSGVTSGGSDSGPVVP